MSNANYNADLKPLNVIVRIVNVKTREDEQVHTVDMRNPASRLWLNKLTWWALFNGRAIDTVNETDNEEYTSDL